LLLVGILGLLEACLDPLDVLLESMNFLGILLRLQQQGLMLLELLLLLLDIDLGLLGWLMRAEEGAQEPRLLLLGLLQCHLGRRLYHLALDGVRRLRPLDYKLVGSCCILGLAAPLEIEADVLTQGTTLHGL
jgi:hypothetical protein